MLILNFKSLNVKFLNFECKLSALYVLNDAAKINKFII